MELTLAGVLQGRGAVQGGGEAAVGGQGVRVPGRRCLYVPLQRLSVHSQDHTSDLQTTSEPSSSEWNSEVYARSEAELKRSSSAEVRGSA